MSDETPATTSTVPEGQFEHELLGRKIPFYNLTHGQLTLLKQRMAVFNKLMPTLDIESRQATDAAHDLNLFLLKVVNSRFVNETDRDAVAESIIEGRTEILDVLAVIGFGRKAAELVPDDAPPPAPKRPTKKTAARKTANPVRAKK